MYVNEKKNNTLTQLYLSKNMSKDINVGNHENKFEDNNEDNHQIAKKTAMKLSIGRIFKKVEMGSDLGLYQDQNF